MEVESEARILFLYAIEPSTGVVDHLFGHRGAFSVPASPRCGGTRSRPHEHQASAGCTHRSRSRTAPADCGANDAWRSALDSDAATGSRTVSQRLHDLVSRV